LTRHATKKTPKQNHLQAGIENEEGRGEKKTNKQTNKKKITIAAIDFLLSLVSGDFQLTKGQLNDSGTLISHGQASNRLKSGYKITAKQEKKA